MSKKSKPIIISLAMLGVSLAALAGASYALYSDYVEVNHHIDAGSLKVGFSRIKSVKHVTDIKGSGLLEDYKEEKEVNLRETNEQEFKIENFVPLASVTNTYKVSNLGTTAFDLGTRLIFDNSKWEKYNESCTKQEELLKMLELTVYLTDTYSQENLLYETTTMYEYYQASDDVKNISLGYLLAGTDTKVFSVKIEFKDDLKNNDVMNFSVDFDIQVYASQKTKL